MKSSRKNSRNEFCFDNPLKNINEEKKNIVYSDTYNISFGKLEKLHPFDSKKWGRVIKFLQGAQFLKLEDIVEPVEASEEFLLQVHTPEYINSLKWSANVAKVTEICLLVFVPNPVVQAHVLKPMRYQVTGTFMAACLAVERGWGINVGGGFHHCCSSIGGGFCAYADITLAIRSVQKIYPQRVEKAMIIDLDAHQGNGHERDFLNDKTVYILDAYNYAIYPRDIQAKKAINYEIRLQPYTEDEEYLRKIDKGIRESLLAFRPNLVVFNAGTDIMVGDQLGCLSITPNGIIQRDEMVFKLCSEENVPIVMVTSGGYQRSTARVIADSILNLKSKNFIQ